VISTNELLDYLRNIRKPVQCHVSPVRQGHVLVSCGRCAVIIPVDGALTVTTLNQIDQRLEACLGLNWVP
jgi:hypothetical protein